MEVGVESTERIRKYFLSFSAIGWLFGIPLPPILAQAAALTRAARDYAAVQKVETGSSPIES